MVYITFEGWPSWAVPRATWASWRWSASGRPSNPCRWTPVTGRTRRPTTTGAATRPGAGCVPKRTSSCGSPSRWPSRPRKASPARRATAGWATAPRLTWATASAAGHGTNRSVTPDAGGPFPRHHHPHTHRRYCRFHCCRPPSSRTSALALVEWS